MVAEPPNDLKSILDLKAEKHVAACLVLDPARCTPLVRQRLTAPDFGEPHVGQFCEAVMSLQEAGKAAGDAGILIRELRAMHLPDNVTDGKFIVELNKMIVNVSAVVYYADRVREMSRLRTIQRLALETYNDASDVRESPDELLARLDAQVATARAASSPEARPIGEICQELFAHWRQALDRPKVRTLLSGFPTLDELGFVLAPGEITVLASRTGVGKTSFATQLGIHHAKKGRTVLMASLEMRDREVVSRLVTSETGFNGQLLRIGNYTHADIDSLERNAEGLRLPPFYIWSPGRVKVSAINAMASVIDSRYGLSLLIVDYIGYVTPDDRQADKRDQIGEVVKGLRSVGQRLNVPVLALCQLNRESDKERPRLAHLRESGCIEEDADAVVLLWPDPKNKESVDFLLEKNRFGKIGSRSLRWLPEVTRFDDSVLSRPNYDKGMEEFNNR